MRAEWWGLPLRAKPLQNRGVRLGREPIYNSPHSQTLLHSPPLVPGLLWRLYYLVKLLGEKHIPKLLLDLQITARALEGEEKAAFRGGSKNDPQTH
jgi:hypothetical protein